MLDYGIACSSALWGLLQPFEHLICGVNSSGKCRLGSVFLLRHASSCDDDEIVISLLNETYPTTQVPQFDLVFFLTHTL